MPINVRARILISGRVQGVGYRAWCRRQARKLYLVGWVRNLEDGPASAGLRRGKRVEVVVEGEKNNVNKLIKLIKKGLPWAKVENAKIFWEDASGEFEEPLVVK